MYYQNHMMKLSKESGLDTIDENPGQDSSLQASERMDSLDSAASHDSISRYFTVKTKCLFFVQIEKSCDRTYFRKLFHNVGLHI